MRRSRLRAATLWVPVVGRWLIGAGALGCHDSSGAETGRLSVRWTGPDTVALSATAVAQWCSSLHLLEIRATAGDTGIALVLYPSDTIDAGVYPVRRPDVADTTRPPSAAVAVRWFSQTTVMGYQGDTGRVIVERTADGSLAGRFAVGARPLVTGAKLRATGTFENLRVVTAPPTCAGPHPADTGRRDTTGAGEAQPDSSD